MQTSGKLLWLEKWNNNILVWCDLSDNFGSIDLTCNTWFEVSKVLVGCLFSGTWLPGIFKEIPELIFLPLYDQNCLVSLQVNTAEHWNIKCFLRTRNMRNLKLCRNIPGFHVNALSQLRFWKDVKAPKFLLFWNVLQHRVNLCIILPGHGIFSTVLIFSLLAHLCVAYDMSDLLYAGWRKTVLEQHGLIVSVTWGFLLKLWFRGFYFKRKDLMISANTEIMGIWVDACLLQVTIDQFRLLLVLVKLWPDDSPSKLCDHMFGYIFWEKNIDFDRYCLMFDWRRHVCYNFCHLPASLLAYLEPLHDWLLQMPLNKQLVQSAME